MTQMIQMIQTLHSRLRDNAGSLFGLVPMYSMSSKSAKSSATCLRGPTHFFISLLLIGCVLLLSACGGGGGGSDGGGNTTVDGDNNMTVDDGGDGDNNMTVDDGGAGDNNMTVDDGGAGDNNMTGDDGGAGDNNMTVDDGGAGDNNMTGDDGGAGDNNMTIDDDDDPTLLQVTGLTVIPGHNSLRLRWTNPVPEGEDNIDNIIAGFNISWQQVIADSLTGEEFRAHKTNQTGSGDAASFLATEGIENGNTYRVALLLLLNSTVLTANIQTVPNDPVPGSNLDNDTLPDSLDDDIDGDSVLNKDGEDNCPRTQNTDQADVNQDGEGDACEEDSADLPATMAVSNLSVVSAATSLVLSWTNPSVGFITAFNITWFPSAAPSDAPSASDSSDRLDDETSEPSVNDGIIASETRTAYTISDLVTDTDYTLEVTLIADEDNSYTNRVLAMTGANADGDAYGDTEDVDDDNNGLIEIYTLDDLAWLRADLDADGIDDDDQDNINAPGNAGCPESGCNGYELMRSLDFMNASSYANTTPGSEKMAEWTGKGWTPIGSCGGEELSTCRFYRGIFDGNDHNISHLKIRYPNVQGGVYGFGMFAGLDGGTMRNLQLLDASFETNKFPSYSGLLVGYAARSRLENLHVMRGKFKLSGGTSDSIGGLAGRVEDSELIRTSVSDITLNFPNVNGRRVGGLVGAVRRTEIVASYAADVSILPSVFLTGAGGMIGSILATGAAAPSSNISPAIIASYVTEVNIVDSESSHLGGFVGLSEVTNLKVIASYVRGGMLLQGAVGTVGGIVAQGSGNSDQGISSGQINASYASVGVVALDNSAHGLSSNADTFVIEDTYWDLNTTGISANGDSRGKTTQVLQSQTTFEGIYANWGNFWCDPKTGEFITDVRSPLATDANRAWDLGNSTQYPALTCTSGGAERQRQ